MYCLSNITWGNKFEENVMDILLLVLTLMKSGMGLLYLLSESIYSARFSTLQ